MKKEGNHTHWFSWMYLLEFM